MNRLIGQRFRTIEHSQKESKTTQNSDINIMQTKDDAQKKKNDISIVWHLIIERCFFFRVHFNSIVMFVAKIQ